MEQPTTPAPITITITITSAWSMTTFSRRVRHPQPQRRRQAEAQAGSHQAKQGIGGVELAAALKPLAGRPLRDLPNVLQDTHLQPGEMPGTMPSIKRSDNGRMSTGIT